jgi:hypothetical protein
MNFNQAIDIPKIKKYKLLSLSTQKILFKKCKLKISFIKRKFYILILFLKKRLCVNSRNNLNKFQNFLHHLKDFSFYIYLHYFHQK